ncbi:MAG: Bro-N domain-containing protein [Chlamydiia bacterium]|nr:Bro-N domain-containing protein [Chlamydiia bacterium]
MQTKINLTENHGVRTGFDGFGRPCVVAKDIATILGYKDSYSVLRIVDEKDKSTAMVSTLTGSRRMGILYPSGILSIATRSKKSKAQELKQWLESEMITSINKIGESDKDSNDSTETSIKVMWSDYEHKMKSSMHELACMLMDAKDIKRKLEVGKIDIVINDRVNIKPNDEEFYDNIPV